MDVWTTLLDLALPRACVHCRGDLSRGAAGPLCAACSALIPPPLEPCCVRCAGFVASRRPLCLPCSGRLHSCRLIRSTTAHRGSAASLVHAFKFRGLAGAAKDAGKRMARRLHLLPELGGFDALVPVPAHPRRRRERGYNQAELLASEIAAARSLPVFDVLERARPGSPAWRLTRALRREELSGAFTLRPGPLPSLVGRRVLIVDDVCATGTTLEECARALRAAGAADVAGWTFSRAGTT